MTCKFNCISNFTNSQIHKYIEIRKNLKRDLPPVAQLYMENATRHQDDAAGGSDRVHRGVPLPSQDALGCPVGCLLSWTIRTPPKKRHGFFMDDHYCPWCSSFGWTRLDVWLPSGDRVCAHGPGVWSDALELVQMVWTAEPAERVPPALGALECLYQRGSLWLAL